ncbi:MAG: DUF2461 domain-containing protein [Actinomycetota bacterium]
MTFTGFPAEALDFYEGLEADNTKTYWTQHKATYESCVRAPMAALCDELAPEFGEPYLFRPYRDLRFARDKSPYKEHQGATVGHGYVHISAAGLFAAAGYYQMAPDQLGRYRAAVDEETTGVVLERLVAKLRAAGYTIGGDRLKTRPRGYDAEHPRIELLRHRTVVAWVDFGAPEWLHTQEAATRVAAAWRELMPLQEWLDDHVGPPREPH